MDPEYLEDGSSEVEHEVEERQEDDDDDGEDDDDEVNISNNDSEYMQCSMVHNHSLCMSQITDLEENEETEGDSDKESDHEEDTDHGVESDDFDEDVTIIE